jgi:DNA-binding GntR family transcriptional regulator
MTRRSPLASISADLSPPAVHRPTSLVDEVYDNIFAQLMALKIAPGARIPVDALARELNVSQTPIREALNRLEAEGLVLKTHLVGYSAAPQITRKHFDDLYSLRLLLEPDGARRAVRALDRQTFAALRSAAGVMLRKNGASDERARYSLFARQDASFHDLILKVAGNELVREAIVRSHAHFHIFRLLFHSRVTEEALEEHEAILAAFKAGDGDAAAAAMHAHIERSRDRLLPVFS